MAAASFPELAAAEFTSPGSREEGNKLLSPAGTGKARFRFVRKGSDDACRMLDRYILHVFNVFVCEVQYRILVPLLLRSG